MGTPFGRNVADYEKKLAMVSIPSLMGTPFGLLLYPLPRGGVNVSIPSLMGTPFGRSRKGINQKITSSQYPL